MDSQNAPESIGMRLRRLRLEKGVTQRALASPGVSHAHISRIEAGTREASVKALRVLAARLGVSADYLEHGVEPPSREEVAHALADAELSLRLGTDPTVRATLETVRTRAESAGDTALLARANAIAGLAAAKDGDKETAIALLELATQDPSADPVADPDLFVTLGASYLGLGREAEAIALYERCLAGVSERIDAARSARVRFATHLSYAFAEGGRVSEAATVLEAVAAEPDADTYSRVRLEWSLGRLAAMQGHSVEALAHMDAAIAVLATTEDDLQRARAELTCAEILAWDGEDERAAERLARCATLEASDTDDLGALRAVQALLAIRRGDRDEAERLVLAALHILGDSEFGRPIACLALALVHVEGDALDDARHAYESGLVSLRRTQMWPQAVSYCRSWAEALEEKGDTTAATAARREAATFEQRLHALA